MLHRFVVGYPYPSMAEHLFVFALIFLAGSVWAACVRRYVQHRLRAQAHA